MDLKKTLKALKLHESTISMILGAIVIVVVGVVLVNFFAKREGEIIPPIEIGEEISLPTTHTVREGETLWGISEKYYGTGYNWVDIEKENALQNPNQIQVGQSLDIPDVTARLAEAQATLTPTTTPEPTEKPQTVVEGRTHKVQIGENLWKIAEMYYNSGYNWVDITSENKLINPNLIDVNQELIIPEVEAKKPTLAEATLPEEPSPISEASYTVEKGDSLWKIAVRAYGDGYKWVEIAKENNLSNPSLIHSGNTLSLPR